MADNAVVPACYKQLIFHVYFVLIHLDQFSFLDIYELSLKLSNFQVLKLVDMNEAKMPKCLQLFKF
jgi:hypothetical protein